MPPLVRPYVRPSVRLSVRPPVCPPVTHACPLNNSKSISLIFIKLDRNIVWVNISVKFDNGPNRPINGPIMGHFRTWAKRVIFGHCKVIFGPRAFKIGTNRDLSKQYNINSGVFFKVKTEFLRIFYLFFMKWHIFSLVRSINQKVSV